MGMTAAGILTIYLRDFIDIDLLRQSDDLRIIFDATYLVIAAWVCVGLGVFIVIISLCGCLGSACMNKVLLGIVSQTLFFLVSVKKATIVSTPPLKNKVDKFSLQSP